MAFSVKNWQDLPSTVTPLSAAALEDLESRLAAYADSVVGSGTDPDAVPKALYAANGTIVTGGLTAGAPIAIPLGPNGTRPKVNTLTAGGFTYDLGMQVFNVKDYGAVGNGSTNDATALNNCLAAAAGNGLVYLPDGVYIANAPIYVPSNSSLLGAGVGLSIIKASDTYTNASMFLNTGGQSTGNSNITIQGIEFDGNKSVRGNLAVFNTGNPSADPNGRPEAMAAMVEFHGDHTSPGLGNNIHFVDCCAHDSMGFGFGFQFIEDSSVIGCYSYDNYRDGITAGNRIRHYAIMGCHVHDNGDDQIAVSSGTSAQLGYNNTILGNTVGPHSLEHAGHGIAMYGLQNSVVSSNAIEGGHSRGIILFASSSASPNNILISTNVLKLPGGANEFEGTGIQIGTASNVSAITDVKVSNNIIRSPLTDGVRVLGTAGGPCRWINIKDNEIVGGPGFGAGHGINLAAHASDIKMVENEIREFDGRGIYHGPTGVARTKIIGGTIENCCQVGGGAGIALGATADVTLGGGLRVLDNQGTPTQTGAVEWGTATQVFLDGCNFYLCSASATFTGSLPATANLGTYVDRAGVLQGGGGSGAADDVATVEDLFDSHTEKTVFPPTTNGATVTYPIFTAPIDCLVTNLSIQQFNASGASHATSDTNYYSVSPVRYRGSGGGSTIATKTTRATAPGAAIPFHTEWDFSGITWSAPNSTLLKGDSLAVLWTATGTPTALTNALVMTVKYEPT